MGSLCLETTTKVFMIVLLSLFHVEFMEGQIQEYPTPEICSSSGCPPYQVIHTQKEFEIRTYQNVTWVSSPVIKAESYENGTRQGFFSLLDYSMGANHEGLEWDVIVPVVVNTLPESKFQLFSYIPKDLQKNPPTPFDDTGISLVTLPRNKFVAIKRFGGPIGDGIIVVEQLTSLKKSLNGTQWQSASASLNYSVAAYNPPWELTNRVNEIMLWFD